MLSICIYELRSKSFTSVMVIAFGVGRFPGFCGSQHIRDPTWSQNPFLNRLGSGSKSCFVGFRCFGNFMFLSCCIYLHACSFMFLSFACIFLSLCIQFLSCSFHWYAFPFMFLSYSFHVHSNVHSCPFIFLSFASMFLSYCIHVLSFPFYSHGNGLMAWPGNRVQQMVIAKLSLRLSLNNPSNIWHCSKKICHKTSKRERERKRVSELDAK